MSARTVVMLLTVAAVVCLLPITVQAQGGTPARVNALEASVAALQSQVGSLQTQVSTLQSQAAALEIALANEATARQDADAAGAIAANAYADSLMAAEAANRVAGDASTHAAANAYADSVAGGGEATTAVLAHHFGPVTLNEITPTPVVRLHNLAAGSYAIFGKIIVTGQVARCNLTGGGGSVNDAADFGNYLDDTKAWTLTLIKTATLAFPSDLQVICTASKPGPAAADPAAAIGRLLVIKVSSQVPVDGAP